MNIDMGIASWLRKFRQLDSSLHKPFTFIFPYPEREWENICALL